MAREVGIEGQLGGQAQVPNVSGTWRDLTENVNQLASNLTGQVRNIAQVTTAVARGDLSQKITVDARGDPGAEVDGQHDGRPALLVRRRGDPRGPRGGHRGARRAGAGAQRLRHLAQPHRQRRVHGLQPDRAGAQHRPGDHRGGPGRPEPEDHRGCPRGDPGAEVDGQHDGRPALLVRRRGDPRGREVGTDGKLGGQGRCVGCRAPGGTSPRTSTSSRRT